MSASFTPGSTFIQPSYSKRQVINTNHFQLSWIVWRVFFENLHQINDKLYLCSQEKGVIHTNVWKCFLHERCHESHLFPQGTPELHSFTHFVVPMVVGINCALSFQSIMCRKKIKLSFHEACPKLRRWPNDV